MPPPASTARPSAPASGGPPPAQLTLVTTDAAGPATPAGSRVVYVAVLTWAFTAFNSVRVLSYLPTLWAIVQSGDSSQHSLWTWGTWLGANVTMALWLHEQQGRRWSRAVVVNLGNALMCLATIVVIAAFRLPTGPA